MAKRNELSIGSKGSDVSELQKKLIDNGYQLAVDGIFGAKTQQAVRDYQKKMGLAVDGIVGVNTWGALEKAADKAIGNSNIKTPTLSTTAQTNTSSNKNTSTNKGKTYTPSTAVQQAEIMLKNQQATKPGAYQASDAVAQAQAQLAQQLASKPGAYQSQWQESLNAIMDKILNREKFSYDLDGDALYQQYKDQYTLQGQQAMMDTMGQAQAMTGGYGNSYAQTVGQQVYQGYMQQLNDRVPELYQLALDQYNREGDEMYNQYGLLADRESQDYGRYQDSLANWNTAYDQAYQQYRDEQGFDYGQYRDQVSDWNNAYEQAYQKYQDERNYDYGKYTDDRNYQYQVDRDAVEDQQWKDSFQYQQDRDAVSDSQWQKEFDEAKRQYDEQYALKTASTKTTSNNNSAPIANDEPKANYDNGTVSDENIKKIQKALGVTADGKWGLESQAAAKKKWGVTSANQAWDAYTPDYTPAKKTGDTGVDVEADLNTYIANGASKSEINTYLRTALNEGIITQTQYTKLKAQYAPAGHTY